MIESGNISSRTCKQGLHKGNNRLIMRVQYARMYESMTYGTEPINGDLAYESMTNHTMCRGSRPGAACHMSAPNGQPN